MPTLQTRAYLQLQALVLGVIGALFFVDLNTPILRELLALDQTFMSHGIVAVGLLASVYVLGCTAFAYHTDRVLVWTATMPWLCELLVRAGAIGTVIGFIIAFWNLDPTQLNEIEDVKRAAGYLLKGMGTALVTTLVGFLTSTLLEQSLRFSQLVAGRRK